MIKLTATAPIFDISPVIQVSEKFQKRELVLNDSWEKDGQSHANLVVIEFSGERMAQLDNFCNGQRVTVEAVVNGREYNGRYFNTIRGLSVTPYQPAQAPSTMGQRPAPAPTEGYAPAPYPTSAYPQPSDYPQQPAAYPPQGGYYRQDGYASAPENDSNRNNNLGPDGLPFR